MDVDYQAFSILVVDDEPDILRSVALNYGDEFRILTAGSGAEGLALLREHDAAVIMADQRMPAMSGAEFLEQSIKFRPDAIRIMLTGYSDMDALIHAINAGRIYRYLAKPWDAEELRLTLKQAVEVYYLIQENGRLLNELREANEKLAAENEYWRVSAQRPHRIVGSSRKLHDALALVAKVAPAPTTVLLEGETGTGKELFARAIHDGSPRRDAMYVPVNCAALTESLLESELFGHAKGAFTGASADRLGLFEVAKGGTVFLDEVSETTPAFQGKLLRVLQEGEIRRVGEAAPRQVDVRIVAATNRKLDEEVEAGRFRQDLYFRLRVFPIRLPPLRERREDVPELARHFAKQLSVRLKKPVGDITPEALAILSGYSFPGNVRELENEIERAILLAEPGADLTDDLLSDHVQGDPTPVAAPTTLAAKTAAFQRAEIEATLARVNYVMIRAAEDLGMTYRGLLKIMNRLDIKKPGDPER